MESDKEKEDIHFFVSLLLIFGNIFERIAVVASEGHIGDVHVVSSGNKHDHSNDDQGPWCSRKGLHKKWDFLLFLTFDLCSTSYIIARSINHCLYKCLFGFIPKNDHFPKKLKGYPLLNRCNQTRVASLGRGRSSQRWRERRPSLWLSREFWWVVDQTKFKSLCIYSMN